MGRLQHPVIKQFFDRGEKLKDNSNRYVHSCKLCGEVFKKGRVESLRKHITKKCTMISSQERINAALRFADIDPQRPESSRQAKQQSRQAQHGMTPLNLDMLPHQQSWTRLEALAEVSRRMDRDDREFGEDDGQAQQHQHMSAADHMSDSLLMNSSSGAAAHAGSNPFHVHDQFAFSSPQSTPQKDQSQQLQPQDKQVGIEKQARPADEVLDSINNPAISVATAATARLNTGSLLARAIGEASRGSATPPLPPPPAASHVTAPTGPFPTINNFSTDRQTPAQMETLSTFSSALAAGDGQSRPSTGHDSGPAQLPWGEYTFGAGTNEPARLPDIRPMMGEPSRSVFRVDRNGGRGRHARARFSEPRRREVQNIRKIGACIRCRILRKTCSDDTPCLTCRKVLSPRVWRSGCIRTKITEKIDLFNARLHENHRKAEVDTCKAKWNTKYPIVVLQATHSDAGTVLGCEALLGTEPAAIFDPTLGREYQTVFPKVVMIDPNDDLPDRMQTYVSEILPELISREESVFSRITLETALDLANRRHVPERSLKLALELWACVEVIDRETSWKFNVQPCPEIRDAIAGPITRETDEDVYKMLGLQLTAAAEQRAELVSKELLRHLQRDLQDGRATIDENMFFAVLLLLISVEKAIWAFKVWEQISAIQHGWPHPSKQPSYFIAQGDQIAELLRMLLQIRKAMPKVEVRDRDGVLVVEDYGSTYSSYFDRVKLKAANVIKRRQDPPFRPTNSRSLELHFCSTILLPEHLLPSQEQPEPSAQASDEASAADPAAAAAAAAAAGNIFQQESQTNAQDFGQGSGDDQDGLQADSGSQTPQEAAVAFSSAG
ncbi:hypothetical protein M406DRAFT_254291 [Cryphonectria parasitica EP155]|uniref:Uncharacterized protein n=1 Tax=Cryphonectria parasitica (strain ATCC 38755 / EP155) TaxID=660469 RepID=A0A9P5CS61_CRYP1|nr:uncharacterized protein M406DRAFT_254291 [Cryphonectria parasitica EP155]KAF3767991.1 hypothetical protein M406DRAFT_254291 [Cryphonectria parasitica EP155]